MRSGIQYVTLLRTTTAIPLSARDIPYKVNIVTKIISREPTERLPVAPWMLDAMKTTRTKKPKEMFRNPSASKTATYMKKFNKKERS